ncbi:MAG: substrate-binding domain-containing protein [Enhygromyxa sp.]
MIDGTLSSSRRARLIGWTIAGAGSAVLLLTGGLLVRWVESGPRPPYLDPEQGSSTDPQPTPKPSSLLRMAGSGSNLPLTRALADAFLAKRPWLRVRVHDSIGSGGGIRATHDRVVELGLTSRPLSPDERALDLTVIPYARVAVVVAANPTVPVRGISHEELLALYDARQRFWSDGSEVVVYLREPGDSGHLAAHAAIPGFAEVDRRALESRRWSVLFHDRAMQEALISTPGAIGLFDQGLATIQKLPLALLEYDGQRPSEDSVRAGSYPILKDLAFVLPTDDHDPLAYEFIAFVFSPEGQKLIRESGYVPLEPPERSRFAHQRAIGLP